MKKKGNFNLFANHAYAPATGIEIVYTLLWFVVGYLLANGLGALLLLAGGLWGLNIIAEVNMISYPLMFIPAMIYIGYISNRNSFSGSGFAIDNNNFGRVGGPGAAVLVAVATLCCGIFADGASSILPAMPEKYKAMFEAMTGGNFIVNFISVSIMAPLFEEWLCRGVLLRGLLTFGRKSGKVGIKPIWAISISAAFFALIHMNPWQALPAFLFGLLFGYVYYITGSLKLTILMHFVNNTTSLILARIPGLDNAESWMDVVPTPYYWVLFSASIVVIGAAVFIIHKYIPLKTAQGSCEECSLGV